ncbi:MAG: hypothetical protein AAF467_09090 [Actinomycetota bacterium]
MSQNETLMLDVVPVAKTPSGGWSTWPAPFLAGCAEPPVAGAPNLDGYWQTVEVVVGGVAVAGHRALGHVQRIEQYGDRVIVTGGGIVHDMRCDGTIERGVHDVAEFDKVTEIRVVASYENGVHVLRPQGMDIEVRRWRDGARLVWDYLGFTAKLEWMAPSSAPPADVGDVSDVASLGLAR